jgi:RNA polymerase sigma factor (sigma-70 family)
MRAASIPARTAAAGPLRSRRLLALAGDARLVEQVRRDNEAAFEVVFERHGAAILGFCRHMLGSPEEAEDAVQHTFAAAYRDLRFGGPREIALKPWLFAIARNRCMSLLRARREQPVGEPDIAPTDGLAEQVERRAELRRLVADLRELPDEQRAALLLTELGDLSHSDVARVLDCEVPRVKALVFRARSQLIAQREARETPCELIRERLANLRGGALRRTELRLHLRDCPGCRAYREQVREQRRMLAVALPVVPTMGLKSSVLAAIGLGGGSAGGAAAAAGAFGGATLAKVAIAGALAGGGIVAGEAVVERSPVGEAPPAPAQPGGASGAVARGEPAGEPPAAPGGAGPREPRAEARSPQGGAKTGSGRGPIAAPPPGTPVRRGPPEKGRKLWKTEPAGKLGAKRRVKRAKEPPANGKAKTGARADGRAKSTPNANGGQRPAQSGIGGGSAPGRKSKKDSRVRPNADATGPKGRARAEKARRNAGARTVPRPMAGGTGVTTLHAAAEHGKEGVLP